MLTQFIRTMRHHPRIDRPQAHVQLDRSWLASLVLVLGLVLLPGGSALAQALPRILSVTGQGTVEVPTSRTIVRLGVEVNAPTAQAAQAQAAAQSNAVVNLLKARSVQDLQTTGISLNPRYNYRNDTRTLEGFTTTNTVSFTVPTADAGPLLDAAVQAGATRIDNLSFQAEEAVLQAAQQDALQAATQNAQLQAQAVLQSLNFQVQEIVGIQVNGSSAPPPPGPVPLAAYRVAAEAAPTPIEGGDQTVTATVTLQIR
ncbi:MAG: SIMPL domain-containing protein, partial [Prochlorothrix sp.]